MADLKKTVEIIFASADKTGAIFSGVEKKLDRFSGKVQNVAQPLATLAANVLKFDAALATLAAAGLAVAINESGKFGDSFKEITTLIDDTGQGVDQFRGDILAYSRDSTKSMQDIGAAIYTAISAGTDYKDSLNLLDDSEKLSIATKSELESSTKLLASTLNAYGESTDQATKYSDILFTTVKKGQTTFPELSTSLASVLNIAANAGVPFETLSAAIAAVTATGAPTSQAITSIQSALSNIIKPSTQATKLANELGIEFNATALKTEGFEKILWKVQEATGGSADKMAVLFGDVNGLSSAMTLGADASGKFKDSLRAMADSAGATERAYQKMADGFKDTNQNLANNVKATFIQIGLELQGNYTDIVSNISEVFKSVGVSLDKGAFSEIFEALDSVGADISQFFSELAKSMPEALEGIKWDGFLSALDELGFSIGRLFDNFDPSDPESVREAIQFVVESLESLIRVSTGMVDSFKPMIDAIKNSVEAFNRMDNADKEATGNVLGLAKALTTLGTGLTTIMLLIGDNADAIESAFNLILGSIEVAWGGFKTGLQVISVAILESINVILAAVEKVTFGDWEEKIKTARAGIKQELDGVYQRLNQSVLEVHSGWDQIVKGVSQGVDQVKERYAEIEKPGVLTVEPILKTRTFDENLALVEQKMAEFVESGEEIEISPISLDLELDTTQLTEGLKEITDYPPDIDPIDIDVNSKSLDDTKNKIKQAFSKSEMGPVEVAFDFGENGTGPVEGFKSAFKEMEPLPAEEIFDMSGLSDLFEQMDEVNSSVERRQMEAALIKQLELRNKAIEAQIRMTRVQAAIAEDMARAADVMWMTSQEENVIKIEASGLEPEMEAFMWKLLKKIQVRANKSGAEFLLAAT